jgi:2'-5' RNA ligase
MRLRKELISNGFKIDDKKFSPHITLGREILLKDNSVWDFKINAAEKVNKISLMKSERINGKLVYTEVFAKQL